MSFANMLVTILVSWYILHILNITLFGQKSKIQTKNIKLDELRSKNVKSVNEQLEFIKLKKNKQPFNLFIFLRTIVIFVILFFSLNSIFDYYKINIQLWQALLFIILFPLLLNIILSRFDVEKDDLFTLLK